MNSHERYISRQARDARAHELRTQGFAVRRRTTGPCNLHPEYVKDYPSLEAQQDNKFGNTLYKTFFPNLYVVEWETK